MDSRNICGGRHHQWENFILVMKRVQWSLHTWGRVCHSRLAHPLASSFCPWAKEAMPWRNYISSFQKPLHSPGIRAEATPLPCPFLPSPARPLRLFQVLGVSPASPVSPVTPCAHLAWGSPAARWSKAPCVQQTSIIFLTPVVPLTVLCQDSHICSVNEFSTIGSLSD